MSHKTKWTAIISASVVSLITIVILAAIFMPLLVLLTIVMGVLYLISSLIYEIIFDTDSLPPSPPNDKG